VRQHPAERLQIITGGGEHPLHLTQQRAIGQHAADISLPAFGPFHDPR